MVVERLNTRGRGVEPASRRKGVCGWAPERGEAVGGPWDDVDGRADRESIWTQLSWPDRLSRGDGDGGVEAESFGADGGKKGEGFDLGRGDW